MSCIRYSDNDTYTCDHRANDFITTLSSYALIKLPFLSFNPQSPSCVRNSAVKAVSSNQRHIISRDRESISERRFPPPARKSAADTWRGTARFTAQWPWVNPEKPPLSNFLSNIGNILLKLNDVSLLGSALATRTSYLA